MPTMPKRPRSHQLEEESRLAFAGALPSNWVFRNKTHDYGIDGEVEIFDEHDNATGMIFYVQLKGTDEKNPQKILKQKLKLDTFRYYGSIKIPILIVKYYSAQEKVFARWVHSKLKKNPSSDQKEFTFYFNPNDELHIILPQLENDIREFYLLRSLHFKLPIKLKLEMSEELSSQGHSKANIILKNENFQKESGNKLLILNEEFDESQLGKVICKQSGTTIYLGGGSGSCTFEGLNSFRNNLKEFLVELTINVGFLIECFGQSASANKIFIKIFKHCTSLKGKTKGLPVILNSLVDASLFKEAILVIKHCITVDSIETIQIASVILRKKQNLIEDFSDFFIQVQKIIREFLENEDSDNSLLGTCFYNEANILRSINRQKDAIKCFNRARHLAPEYENRDYFWKELAGSLFGVNKYGLSAKCYKNAINITPTNSSIWALYADAAMYSGNYEEAEEWFNKYVTQGEDLDHLWVLKEYCLSIIGEENKIAFQSRKISEALSISQEAEVGDEHSLEHALELDRLCSLAWGKLGKSLIKQNKYEEALPCFLWAAVTSEKDVDSWANAFIVSNFLGKLTLTLPILDAAYQLNGPSFLDSLHSLIEKNIPNEHAEEIKLALLKFTREIDKKAKELSKIELRLISKDHHESIKF